MRLSEERIVTILREANAKPALEVEKKAQRECAEDLRGAKTLRGTAALGRAAPAAARARKRAAKAGLSPAGSAMPLPRARMGRRAISESNKWARVCRDRAGLETGVQTAAIETAFKNKTRAKAAV